MIQTKPSIIKNPYQNDMKNIMQIFPSSLVYSIQGDYFIKINKDEVNNLFIFLKRHTEFTFNQLIDITAIDHSERKLRFEVVYQLLSLSNQQRLTISLFIAEGTTLDTITSIYPSAG